MISANRGIGLALALAVPAASAPGGEPACENVVLVLVDDVGVDLIEAYGEHPDPARTPTIDALAAGGLLFRNVWGHPVCSSSRAALMTGRAAHRTGIGNIVPPYGSTGLAVGEVTLAELVDGVLSPALIGKWHLATAAEGVLNPNDQGWRMYSGSLHNLQSCSGDYTNWRKVTNGVIETEPSYATTRSIDDALWLIELLPEPWLLLVSLNAAHPPFHAPPRHLHTQPLPTSVYAKVRAMVEAMDTELGRLVAELPANTTGLLTSDNGTASLATSAPFDPEHAKGTLYEGGVGVPLIAWGPRVATPGAECSALVQLSDVFATVAEIAGVASTAEDSVSLLPYLAEPGLASIRSYVFAAAFGPNGPGPYVWEARAVRGERYKLIQQEGGSELYDLVQDPHEQASLALDDLTPTERMAYEQLLAVIGSG